ncbi:MAG: hypothetical protein M1818_005481 [Claussenomyces sp. TS43310]|nr:MAG: hypothetical protein M1818_005481 [Claussenomyces sp. TS43310]
MPNYYPRPGNGLITPPGSEMYGYGHTAQVQYGQTRKSNAYDPANFIAPPAPLMYQPPPMHYSNMPTAPPPGLTRSSFGPVGPPISDNTAHNKHSRRDGQQEQRPQHQQQPTVKQEKIVGGVAQELDYEMDQMTDYVSEMAQEMYALLSNPHICLADIDIARSVMPRAKVSPAFRKFVSGLLSATRLPSSTILLGLNYLAKRMSMLNKPTPYKTTDGQVWRMLTIALLLGSKFLDDNTFQNRSWSEVSGIPVAELNTLESEWLVAIKWNLHVDPVTDSDFQCWLASWDNWKEIRNKQRTATLDRLAPLASRDNNIQRQRSPRKEYSPPSAYPSFDHTIGGNHQSAYQQRCFEQQPSWSQPTVELSPPSGPESGPTTPEWMGLPGLGLPPTGWYGYDSFYNRRPMQSSTQMPYVAQQSTPYHTPFVNHYQQSHWNGHPAGCGCGFCSHASESYFMAPGYGQQTVVG